MRTLLGCVALLLTLLLSASHAEGQVKINPIYEGDTKLTSRGTALNDGWIVTGNGSALIAQSRHNINQKLLLWLDNGGRDGSGVENLILHDNLLVVGGEGPYASKMGTLGIWDLNNLVQERIKRTGNPNYNPEGQYIPQNWTVKERGLKFVFLNKDNNLVGIYSDESGLVSVYEIFGDSNTPTQEIFVGTDVLSLSYDENLFAIGKNKEVLLFKYNSDVQLYEHVDAYKWQGSTFAGGLEFEYAGERRLGLTISENGDSVYLVIATNTARMEIIQLKASNFKIVARTTVDSSEIVNSHFFDVDGDFIVLRGKIFHIPSASLVGEYVVHDNNLPLTRSACIRDLGERVEMITTESDLSIAVGYLSIYDEPILSVSTPKKVSGGFVKLLTSSRVFRGGSATFTVVANSGYKIRYIQKEASSKKIIKKKTGGLVYKIKNIQSHTGLKKVKFATSAGMKEYSIYAPYTLIFGRPTPDGDSRKWRYNLSVGDYIGLFVSPTPGEVPRTLLIRVKANGTSVTAPIIF